VRVESSRDMLNPMIALVADSALDGCCNEAVLFALWVRVCSLPPLITALIAVFAVPQGPVFLRQSFSA
jgi:hypothetical protein